MRPGFYRAGYVTYTDLSYMLFFPRVRKQLLLETVLDTRSRPSRGDLRKSVSLDLRARDFDLRVAVRCNFRHGRP